MNEIRESINAITQGIYVIGAPLIYGVMAHLDCKLRKSIEAGDHILFIGEVIYSRVFEGIATTYHKKGFLVKEGVDKNAFYNFKKRRSKAFSGRV
jgi:flavin reductase (DIM6/NTAB) family NADH-FMN oxidoreductase RutF